MTIETSGEARPSSLAAKIGWLTGILVAVTTLLTTIEVLVQKTSSFTGALGSGFSWCQNGDEAAELRKLEAEIAKLEAQLNEARRTANPAATDRLQKELAGLQNRQHEIESQPPRKP